MAKCVCDHSQAAFRSLATNGLNANYGTAANPETVPLVITVSGTDPLK